MRFQFLILGMALAVAALGALTPASGAPPGDATKALMGKNLVDIGGRRLNLICLGEGSPTVVFEQGLGSHLLHWQKIAGPVSQFTRACYYDRASLGFSDAAARPADAANVTSDLRDLLRRGGVKGPVVLVGHSLGGLFVTLYADRFVEDVGGLVLVDPSFADQDENVSTQERARDESGFHKQVAQWQACAALAHAGSDPTEGHPECFAPSPTRTPEEINYLKIQFSRADYFEALISEAEAFHPHNGARDADSSQEIEARRSFGVIPLIVLTRSIQPKDADETDEEYASAVASWTVGHDRLAARSTRGESVIVPNSGHFIQIEQPDAVTNAIRKVVDAARNASP